MQLLTIHLQSRLNLKLKQRHSSSKVTICLYGFLTWNVEFEEKVSKDKFKEYQDKAEKFCKAEIYSYILYTAFEYEMVT